MKPLELRAALGRAALFSVAETARALGKRPADVRPWLEARDLIRRDPLLGERVVWGDVLDALGSEQAQPVRYRPKLPRGALKRTT